MNFLRQLKSRFFPIASISFLLFIFIQSTWSVHAQNEKKVTFGEPTQEEIQLTTYAQDPTADAVVTYEKGVTEVKVINDFLRLVTKVHRRIKVLDAQRFGSAIFGINYYETRDSGQKITHLKALTHNGEMKTYVSSDDFFTKDQGGNWKEISFTFPKISDQSILEYTYIIESPYFSTFGWDFQDVYPTMYSQYVTEIPGNYVYRMALRGKKKLDSNVSFIKNKCFYIDGYGAGDCYFDNNIMLDVPAFKEEKYMLSKENYLSSITYELKEHRDLRGNKTKITNSWRDVDREIRYDSEAGKELKNISFFEKSLPENIKTIKDPLTKAKSIYAFIQSHYSWNKQYRIYDGIDVTEAYKRGSGNVAEINISLICALNAVGLDAKLALSTTRDRKVPNLIFPVLTDFNYVMGYLKVGKEEYYLDATSKYNPFGVIPQRGLNYKARIMDFKEGSFWNDINPFSKNQDYLNIKVSLTEEELAEGIIKNTKTGYYGVEAREEIIDVGLKKYLLDKAKDESITNYNVKSEKSPEEPLEISFNISKDLEVIGAEYSFNPFFLLKDFQTNPFQSDTRDFPINLGYPYTINYLMNIDLAQQYEVTFLPEDLQIKLPDNLGVCTARFQQINGQINLRFNLQLSQHSISPEYYGSLKEFFAKIIVLTTKNPIIFKKV